MQTLSKYGAKANRVVCEFDGLSTDTKPTVSFTEPNTNATIYIDNGSVFNEMDTGKKYKYDKEHRFWYEEGSEPQDYYQTEGAPPISFYTTDTSLIDCVVHGNEINGQKVGKRTINLFGGQLMEGYYTDNTFTTVDGDLNKYRSVNIYLPAGSYTLAFSRQIDISVFAIKNGVYNNITVYTTGYSFTLDSAADISVGFSLKGSPTPDWDDSVSLSLNEGDSRAIEPYGYKIPILIDGENIFDNNNPSVFNASVDHYYQKWEPANAKTIKISCSPSTTYTLSLAGYRSFTLATIATDDLPSAYPPVAVHGSYYNNKITFTTAADAKYILVSFASSNLDIFINELKINYGSNVLPTTTNIYIDNLLGIGETVSAIDSGVNIPTTYGLNTLSIDSEVQPSTVKIKYV